MREKLYLQGDDYFADVLRDVDQAQKEILVETYIWSADSWGLEILAALHRAHLRGVAVSFLIDGVGSYLSLPQLIDRCHEYHLPLRLYHPVPFSDHWKESLWKINLSRFIQFFSKVNQRDHRKLFIVDERLAFVGSFNLTAVHSKKISGPFAWRDTAIRVEADSEASLNSLGQLRRSYFKNWRKAKEPERKRRLFRPRLLWRRASIQTLPSLRKSALAPFRLNDSLRMRVSLQRDLLRRIRHAKTRVLITNAYFLPRRSLLRALQATARRGVYVGLCLPAKTDVWFVREASRLIFRHLIEEGVVIYEYEPSVLHAKTLVVDDWAVIGSHNLNHRSFLHDLEVEYSSESPALVEELVQAWDQDLRLSQAVHLTDLDRDGYFRKFVAEVFFLLRYWL